ncbi:MAG: GTP-binding protein [Clostridia bacterium]
MFYAERLCHVYPDHCNTVDPEYLIVEPTGVGILSKIIENIQKIEYERITLLEPLTILDGTMYDRCMSEFSEICEDQIQSAGRILVSKMESAAENERCSLKQKRQRSIRKLRSVFSLYRTGR